MPTLDIAVVTNGKDGIKRIAEMLLPPAEGIRYVVSWQNHCDTPIPSKVSERKDVEVHRLELTGISNNRNNAISHCKGDIILISDDDLIYDANSLQAIREVYASEPSLDFALFRIDFPRAKNYPPDKTKISLPLPRGYWVSSIEITFRREKFRDLRFWDKLGLGAKEMHCGEEELFIMAAIKRGYKGIFIDKVIACHPSETSTSRHTPGVLTAQGFIITLSYPTTALPRIFLKAYRNRKLSGTPMLKSVRYLLKGMRKAIFNSKDIPGECKW